MTNGSAETKQDLVVRIAEKWFKDACFGDAVTRRCESAIREALLEMADKVEHRAMEIANEWEREMPETNAMREAKGRWGDEAK